MMTATVGAPRSMLAAVSLVLAVSCASNRGLAERASSLKRGDPTARALQLLGTPDDRQFEEDDEVLQYCNAGRESGADYALVWLYKGTVTGVTTYRRVPPNAGSCRTGFKAVHWEDAPDRNTAPSAPAIRSAK